MIKLFRKALLIYELQYFPDLFLCLCRVLAPQIFMEKNTMFSVASEKSYEMFRVIFSEFSPAVFYFSHSLQPQSYRSLSNP